jgi:WD40 repeat protein
MVKQCEQSGVVAEWSMRTGKLIAPLARIAGSGPHPNTLPMSVSFSPTDDQQLAVAGHNGAQLFDARTGSATDAFQGGFIPSVAYSPDGSTIASVDFNGLLTLTDSATGQPAGPPFAISQLGLNSVGWSPDGSTVVTSDWNGIVRLTDVATGREIGPPFRAPEPDAPFPGQPASFTQWWMTEFTPPDGRDVVVSDDTGKAWVFPVSLNDWEARACQVADRNLTAAEWAQYVPGVPYQNVCPPPPSPAG